MRPLTAALLVLCIPGCGAVGVERCGYDGNGNVTLEVQEAGSVQHLSRTTSYDGLDRPLQVSETVASASGSLQYQQLSAYDDTAHVAYSRDRRGIVTRRELDDLDRVTRQVVDDAAGLLLRTVSTDAGPALALQTLFAYDANGNRSSTTDPLGRVTQEIYDGLNRLTDRRLPMGVSERFTYDGANRQLLHVDVRGIEHRTSYDLAGRPVDEFVTESLSNQGQPLRLVHRSYEDIGLSDGLRRVVEVDAAFHSVSHITDGLHREVITQDPRGERIRAYFDANVKRAVVDRRGLRTEFDADAADRPVGQREYDLGGALAFTQITSYDDGARTETSLDRRGIATVRQRDGLGRIESVARGSAPDRQVTLSEYDEDGNLVEVTDPNGHVGASTYDGANRRISDMRGVGTPDQTTTRYTLDKVGNRVEQSNPRTGTFVSHDSFDDLNRLVRSEDPLGNVTSRAYDEAGNLPARSVHWEEIRSAATRSRASQSQMCAPACAPAATSRSANTMSWAS